MDISIYEEGFKEVAKKIVEKVKAFFKWIWNKFLAFISLFKAKKEKIIRNLKDIEEFLKSKKFKDEDLKEASSYCLSYNNFNKLITIINNNFQKMSTISIVPENFWKINEVLKYVGLRVEEEVYSNSGVRCVKDDTFVDKELRDEKSNLYDLGYRIHNIIDLIHKYKVEVQFNPLIDEIRNKQKEITKQVEEAEKDFIPDFYLKQAIAEKNMLDIYSCLTLIANRDRALNTFYSALEYVKEQNIPGLMQRFDKRPFEPKEKWDIPYWELILSSLIDNFSVERIEHLSDISKVLYKKENYKYKLSVVRMRFAIAANMLKSYEAAYKRLIIEMRHFSVKHGYNFDENLKE